MKILLISGHGAGDSGACGNGCREADLTREVVNTLAPKLRQYATVDIYPQNRNAYDDVNRANLAVSFANYNYVFEVHFNAGGGKGTEIYVTREEAGIKVEQKVMDKLSSYFNVRGVKRKNFNVIAKAKKSGASSALLETCFIDSSSDVNTYKNNVDGICQAICEGIAEGFGLKDNGGNVTPKPVQPAKKSNDEIANEVIAGQWGNGADRQNRLQVAGYDYNTIQAIVNQKLGVGSSKKSIDTIANEVIKGLWGNGQDRKNRLRNAGYDYNVIQKRVNQLLR